MTKDGNRSTPPPSSEPTPEELYERLPPEVKERLERLKLQYPELFEPLETIKRFTLPQLSPELRELVKPLQLPPELMGPLQKATEYFTAARPQSVRQNIPEAAEPDPINWELGRPHRMEERQRQEVEQQRQNIELRRQEVELQRRMVEALEALAPAKATEPRISEAPDTTALAGSVCWTVTLAASESPDAANVRGKRGNKRGKKPMLTDKQIARGKKIHTRLRASRKWGAASVEALAEEIRRRLKFGGSWHTVNRCIIQAN